MQPCKFYNGVASGRESTKTVQDHMDVGWVGVRHVVTARERGGIQPRKWLTGKIGPTLFKVYHGLVVSLGFFFLLKFL